MPKGLRKFHFIFGKTGLTRWGGLTLFAQFCKSLSLRRHLQCYVHWPEYHHKRYHPVDLLLAHIFAITAGIGRIENTHSLIHNGFIPPLLGLPEFPHRDTLRTFLWRFNSENLQSLQRAHDRLRDQLSQRLGIIYSAIIDADMTVLTVFGHQGQAQMGYNPRYRGKRSYAPLISSEGQSGLSLNLQLRPGNLHPAKGAWAFLEPIIEKLLLREFKDSFFMAQIPTRSFWANATYMEMILWAYDIVLAFQYPCLPKNIQHWNISTLRRELWWLPAEWVRRGTSNILWLPVRYPNQNLFLHIQRAISRVKPLI